MEFMTRLLFERPYLQGALMGIAILVTLIGWWRFRYEPDIAKRWGLAALILAILAAAGQITASLVTTDRERIEALLEKAREAVGRGDAQALVAMTDESLVAEGRNRQEFARWLEDTFRQMKILKPSIQDMQITFQAPDAATAVVSGMATVQAEGFSYPASGTWKFELGRFGQTWKIVTLEPVEAPRRFP
jgi:ketosteroid isomerase-like protein